MTIINLPSATIGSCGYSISTIVGISFSSSVDRNVHVINCLNLRDFYGHIRHRINESQKYTKCCTKTIHMKHEWRFNSKHGFV